jgi:predicted membrane-bound spermidine synthase
VIEVLIYLLIGAALALISSINNDKYEQANESARKVPKKAFFLIAVFWPIILLIWITLMFTAKKEDLNDK